MTRRYAGSLKAVNVSPQPPGTKYARKDIPVGTGKTALRCVNFELDKQGAFQMIVRLTKFLLSNSTHVDLKGDRRSKTVSVSHRIKS